jgi:PhzF family phenazine biosynthesis protein
MKIPYYQVDAFASDVFAGNPAGVCLLDSWCEDQLLQAIAAENNLSETAFLVPAADGFELRWFTPVTEVALCGHATLASAFVLFDLRGWSAPAIRFATRHSGTLVVTRDAGLLVMDFPARPATAGDGPPGLLAALGVDSGEIRRSAEDLLVVLDSEARLRSLAPDFAALAAVDGRGVIVTARGEDVDFVSRFFAPRVGVPEDPVTGSAHCVLIPYWSGILGKKTLRARQVSRRGGELFCQDCGDRVRIGGQAALYLEGTLIV